MRLYRLSFLVLVSLALVPCAGAAAASIAPPGNSGVDQYFESVPSAGGNQPPATGGGPSSTLSAAARHALAASGADGRAAAALAASGAPAPTPVGSGAGSYTPPLPTPPSATVTPPRPASATGSSGISPLLAIILGAALLGALAIALIRRHGGASPPPSAS